ncbi:MAG: aspartate aminotransferase family protein [Haloarculaceae archaeon]
MVDPWERYRERTPESKRLADRATSVLPGGDTRSVTHYRPYPSYVTDAEGPYLHTVDDERLVDFLNNYTQAVLGHAPDPVVEAACDRIRRGNGIAAPTEAIVDLAERVVDRTPSIDAVRFANSGTEATMNAIRAAMADTGNERVLKVEGGYHGTHDTVEVAVGDEGVASGVPADVRDRVDAVAYNDVEALKARFAERGDDYACFVVEPVMGVGGMIPAEREYLETARDLTAESNTALVFDEVMTYRLAPGGAQEAYGVTPDLTALGKLIGGGLPVGGFGGDAAIMRQFHPTEGDLNHSGTFNGNPATMAAGAATLDRLDADTIDRLNARGERLRERLAAVAADASVPMTVTGKGSLFQFHFTDGPVTDADTSGAGGPLAEELFVRLRNEGLVVAPRGMGNLSTPMDDDHLDALVDGVAAALSAMDHPSE